MLQTVANWLCIFGFAITLVTLLMTVNIRGKIERSLGKQRFLQQRATIVSEFTAVRNRIKGGEKMDSEALEELRALLLQLTHYRIWHMSERMQMKKFIGFLSRAYSGEKRATGRELVLRIDEIIAVVKSQAEV